MKTTDRGDDLLEVVRGLVASGDAESALELVGTRWREWQASGELAEGSAAAALALEAGKGSRSIWRTRTLYADGIFAFRMGDMERSRARNDEALQVARDSGDVLGECQAVTGLARVALREGRYEDVVALARQGRDRARSAGDAEAEASPLHLHAAGVRLQHRYEDARDLYLESLHLNERLGASAFAAMEHHNLGWVELHMGNVDAAADHFRQRDARPGGDVYGDAWADLNWAAVAIKKGDAVEAQRRFAAGKRALDSLGLTLDPDDKAELDWLTDLMVVPRAPSQSAMLTAAARALHREEAPPLILDDELALGLAGARGGELIERARTLLGRDGILSFSRWVCARARATEDLVEQSIGDGIGQYVILGAGLDSFAYRRTDLADRLRVFEVDHPASQAWKRQRLAEIGVAPPANLTFAPVDFESQTLESGLRAAGFDFASRAVFGWLGVTMYLTLDAIRATLASVASCAAGTRIALTYNQPPANVDAFGRRVTTTLAAMIGEVGEPFISVFTPDEIEDLMRSEGYVSIQHFGPEDAVRAYFPGRDDVRIANAQRLLTARVP